MESGICKGLIYQNDIISDPANLFEITLKYMAVEADQGGPKLIFVHSDIIAAGTRVSFDRVTGTAGKDDFAINVRPVDETGVFVGEHVPDRITDPMPPHRSGLNLGYYLIESDDNEQLLFVTDQPFPEGTRVVFNKLVSDSLLNKKNSAINVRLIP